MSPPVEVACATPERQLIIEVAPRPGMTIMEAVLASGILAHFPDIEAVSMAVGIFGKLRAPSDRVCAGDRVEIYRPLLTDPRDARRARARQR